MKQVLVATLALLFFPPSSWAQESPQIIEQFLDDPDQVTTVVENAVNNNKPLDLISYFPINTRISFNERALRLNSVSIPGNLLSFPYFEDIDYYNNIRLYSTFFINAKMAIFRKLNPEFEFPQTIKTDEEATALYNRLKDGMSPKIRIKINKKHKWDRGSIFKISDGYLYECTVYLGDDVLSESALFNVFKIDGKWKIVNAGM